MGAFNRMSQSCGLCEDLTESSLKLAPAYNVPALRRRHGDICVCFLGISKPSVLQVLQPFLDEFAYLLCIGDAAKHRGVQVASSSVLVSRRSTPSSGFDL